MKQHPFLWFLAITGFFFLFVIVIGVLGIFSLFGQKPSMLKADSIGVVKIEGIITDAEPVLKAIETFKEEKTIKAVIIRIDSPGGAVGPSQEIYQAVKELRQTKKVVASLGSLAASGGYYVACGADQIVANPGTVTGSIGVLMEFVNMQELYRWAKMDAQTLKSGKYKDTGSPLRPMREDEKALLDQVIQNIYQQFKKAVLESRVVPTAHVEEVTDGRILSGEQAKKMGLVDLLGNFQSAVELAKQLANLKGKPELVYPPKERQPWIQYLFGESLTRALEKITSHVQLTSPFLYMMPGFK